MIKYTILYFQTGPQFFTAAFLEYTDNNKIKLIHWKYTGELNTSTLHRKEGGGDLKDDCTDPFPVLTLVTGEQ